MPTTRYIRDLDQIAEEAIATEGLDEAGWKACGIGEKTFYRYLIKHDSFRQAVERGRNTFRRACPPRLRALGLQRLADALENGHIVTWETQSSSTVERRNAAGDIIFTDTINKSAQHVEKRGTPSWAIDRVLPKAMNLEDAIKAIQAAGFIVVDPTVRPKETQQQGLTEEGADLIKARILFGETHPELEGV